MKTLTELIMQSATPWNNPYQGNDKRVLFVCSAGILRSATAARIYARKYNTRCAGSEEYALIPISDDLILWANEIVFVNGENYRKFARQYADLIPELKASGKKIVILDIPDRHEHMAPELIAEFERQYEPLE